MLTGHSFTGTIIVYSIIKDIFPFITILNLYLTAKQLHGFHDHNFANMRMHDYYTCVEVKMESLILCLRSLDGPLPIYLLCWIFIYSNRDFVIRNYCANNCFCLFAIGNVY